MENINQLLINVLFLIVYLLFIPMFISNIKKGYELSENQFVILICSALGLVSCMLFPVYFGIDFILDLRWVPVVIGSLFTSFRGALILAGCTIVSRMIIGGLDAGFITTALTMSTLLLSFFLYYHYCKERVSKKQKTAIVVLFSLFQALQVIIIHGLVGVAFTPWFAVTYIFILTGTTFVIAYSLSVIMEMNLLYRKVIKAEKMEVVSQLAASISHEVRNPLTVVKGFLQLLEDETTSDIHRSYIQLSLDEVNRANDIIVSHLSYAKSTPDTVELVNVSAEINKALKIIESLGFHSHVDREFTAGDAYMIGNAQLLQQCLLNIMKNCMEAMDSEGKMKVVTRDQGNEIVIELSDTGQGMTKEQLARLGEPYFTTKGREGTGLGMLAVYRIVEILQGRIVVQSQKDKGTRFVLYFKMARE